MNIKDLKKFCRKLKLLNDYEKAIKKMEIIKDKIDKNKFHLEDTDFDFKLKTYAPNFYSSYEMPKDIEIKMDVDLFENYINSNINLFRDKIKEIKIQIEKI